MADQPIRWEAAKLLTELLKGHELLDGCQVEPGFPGELKVKGAEYLYLDEIVSSDVSVPTMRSGTLDYDDQFDLRWIIRVAGRPSIDEAMVRTCEIDAAAHVIVATDHTLDDLDGVVSAVITERSQMVANTVDGPIGHGLFVVHVHSRISPS